MKRIEIIFYLVEAIVIILLMGVMVNSILASQEKVPTGQIGVVIGDNIARGPVGRLSPSVNLSVPNEYGSWAYEFQNQTGWKWYNQAIANGNTTNVLNRWDRDVLGHTVSNTVYYRNIPDTTLPKKPTHVVVIVGKNDIAEDIPVGIIQDNLIAMAESTQENNITAVFCTIPPSAGINTSKLLEVNAWMVDNLPGKNVRVWDAYTFFSDPKKINVLAQQYDDTRGRPSSSAIEQAAMALWRNDPLDQNTATNMPIGVVIGDLLACGRGDGRLEQPVNLDLPTSYGSFAYEFENLTGWAWYNQAIPSSNTTSLLYRWNRDVEGQSVYAPLYYPGIPNMTLPKKPSYAVVIVGRNDLAEQTSTTKIKNNLEAMAKSAQKNNIKVVFCTLAPAEGLVETDMLEINEWMKKTLPRYGATVWDMYGYFKRPDSIPRFPSVFDPNGHLRIQSDDIDRAALALWRESLHEVVQIV